MSNPSIDAGFPNASIDAGFNWPPPFDVGVSLAVMLSSSLWERHSAWWQEAFTEGADPEYEEQVLPLVENSLRGARRV